GWRPVRDCATAMPGNDSPAADGGNDRNLGAARQGGRQSVHRARFDFSDEHVHMLPNFFSLRQNAIADARVDHKQVFESLSERAAGCVNIPTTWSAGHGSQGPRYPKMNRHRRLLIAGVPA